MFGSACPYLLTVNDVVITLTFCGGLQRASIGAGAWFRYAKGLKP